MESFAKGLETQRTKGDISMSSVANLNQLVTVPFHGNKLFIVEHNNEPYTPMKPIVEGMGLTWQPQLAKLNSNAKRWGITKIVIPTLGDLQEMVCLPLRKIFGWLMTISPNKVKLELKPTIEKYQNECDDVLWQYWNNKLKTNSDQRTPLRRACDRLAVTNMLTSDAYKIVWEQYGVNDIDQIPLDRLAEATAFVYEMILRLQKTEVNKQPTDKQLYEILHAAISSHHQLHRMTKSLAVTLHVRDTIDYQLRSLREDIIKTMKFAHDQGLRNKLGLPLVSHEARLNAWDGASWSIAVLA